ncbi:hypothetical protein ES708_20233 [subsurface metagenome]
MPDIPAETCQSPRKMSWGIQYPTMRCDAVNPPTNPQTNLNSETYNTFGHPGELSVNRQGEQTERERSPPTGREGVS